MFLIHRGSCLVNAFLLLCAIIQVKMMSDYIQFTYILWQQQISLIVTKSRHTGMGTNNNKRIVQLTVLLLYGLPISQMNGRCVVNFMFLVFGLVYLRLIGCC